MYAVRVRTNIVQTLSYAVMPHMPSSSIQWHRGTNIKYYLIANIKSSIRNVNVCARRTQCDSMLREYEQERWIKVDEAT